MADEVSSQTGEVSLTTGAGEIPALAMGESGYNGLLVLGGQVLEECQHELQFPQAIETYKRMAKDGSIAPALELIELMVARAKWVVKIPQGYEEKLADKANFLRQQMVDMEHSWESFIKQCITFNRYGFSIHEKVYRYRKKENGSKYDDGLIGIKKLPFRSQDSVYNWRWKNYGRELAGFNQLVNNITNEDYTGWDFTAATATPNGGNVKFIPKKKFLHFRNSYLKDNPWGESPLKGAWVPWKYKTALQEAEAIGVAQDSNGFKVLYLPPQYLREDASESDKAVYKEYKRIIANMHVAKQSGMILPLILDENGNKLFEFDIKSITGQKSFDTNQIISRYTAEILVSLFADFLALGSTGSGSFSLAESKVDIIGMAIESKLDEIKSQLNHDLVRQLFELNGWDTDVTPYFDYSDAEKISLDELSKFVQRTAAVAALPKTPQVINWVMEKANVPYRVDNEMPQEELKELLGEDTSRSGDGMAQGMGSGTGSAVGSSGDSSAGNTENA